MKLPEDQGPDDESDGAGILQLLGLDDAVIREAVGLAQRSGATLETVLVQERLVAERDLYRRFAALLGLPFSEALPEQDISDIFGLDILLREPNMVRISMPNGPARTAIVPQARLVGRLQAFIEAHRGMADRLVITTPSAMRAAIWARGADRRVRNSAAGLFDTRPVYSARLTLHGKQGFWFGCTLSTLIALALTTSGTLEAVRLFLSLLYAATLAFRISAALVPVERVQENASRSADFPVYTILVALYREASVVPQLLASLQKLDWPASRLDIKFVCEAIDEETLNALSGMDLPPYMEVVRVPDHEPRTKPKALTYALAGARGDYVAVYDAEDRPHPSQLRAAHACFSSGDASLACVQAPLLIANRAESWLSNLFAAEYDIHFYRFIPFLARKTLPVPLGGTSNHFRREALEKSGGWDPHNVTEDADLGLRLHRLGYKVGTIRPPTLEDAPTSTLVWISQRTRWYKGWLQTYLVSMRDPGGLIREMGLKSFLAFNLMTFGMLASAICHPWLYVSLAWLGWHVARHGLEDGRLTDQLLCGLDLANLMASYAFFAFARRRPRGRRTIPWRRMAGIPLYWLLLSVAAWRALFDLYHRPHFWSKTPHAPSDASRKT